MGSITTSQSNDGFVHLPKLCVNKPFSELEDTVYHVPLNMGNSLIRFFFFWFFWSMFFFVSIGWNKLLSSHLRTATFCLQLLGPHADIFSHLKAGLKE